MTTTPIIPLADLIADLRTQPTTIAAQTAADRLEEMATGGAHSIRDLVAALNGNRDALAVVRNTDNVWNWSRTGEGCAAATELARIADLLGAS